ncbi:hypothetical protein NZK35_23590 [Stieleria sp. ICT_E10.1]|uniref:hypothetical protein n=1 Tax=Stieleria sedimenti TaxID=2976331 RepID=UPI00218077EF|nr:hypothetical protein [Stieleria sedimenti]MCS7469644.1 hypothetical protein [Stieleria sedimenti]
MVGKIAGKAGSANRLAFGIALAVVKHREPVDRGFRIPTSIPIVATAANAVLVCFVSWFAQIAFEGVTGDAFTRQRVCWYCKSCSD